MRRFYGGFEAVGFTKAAQNLYDRAAPAVADAFNRQIVPVVQRASDEWPISTGHSRASLFVRLGDIEAETMTVELGNSAPYAAIIHSGETAETLLFVPIREAARRAALAIAINISRVF